MNNFFAFPSYKLFRENKEIVTTGHGACKLDDTSELRGVAASLTAECARKNILDFFKNQVYIVSIKLMDRVLPASVRDK